MPRARSNRNWMIKSSSDEGPGEDGESVQRQSPNHEGINSSTPTFCHLSLEDMCPLFPPLLFPAVQLFDVPVPPEYKAHTCTRTNIHAQHHNKYTTTTCVQSQHTYNKETITTSIQSQHAYTITQSQQAHSHNMHTITTCTHTKKEKKNIMRWWALSRATLGESSANNFGRIRQNNEQNLRSAFELFLMFSRAAAIENSARHHTEVSSASPPPPNAPCHHRGSTQRDRSTPPAKHDMPTHYLRSSCFAHPPPHPSFDHPCG